MYAAADVLCEWARGKAFREVMALDPLAPPSLEPFFAALGAPDRPEDAREKFASAIQNKRAEMESRENLRAQSERIAAELAEIESALGSTLSRIVAMEDLQEEAARESGQGISSKLGDVLATVDALEEALSEVLDPARRRART